MNAKNSWLTISILFCILITRTVMAVAVNITGSIKACIGHGNHLLKEKASVSSSCPPPQGAKGVICMAGVSQDGGCFILI
jgi:hypothetical protein